MSVELLVNIIVILLLIPTIIFALLLNKRLEILRSSRADLGRKIIVGISSRMPNRGCPV